MSRRLVLGLLVGALALAGCDDDDKNPDAGLPKVELPALAPGAHALRLGGDAAGTSGWAFVADDGRALVQLAQDSDTPTSVVFYRDGASRAWRRVPAASGPMTLSAELAEAQSLVAPALAGSYEALLGGKPARFTVAADGKVTATAGDCRLSGRIDAGEAYGGGLPVQAEIAGCAALAGAYRGLAFADPDAKNARFRVVLHDVSKITDFYAFVR